MEQINGPIGFDLKYNPRGMICLTDLPATELGPIVSFTGPYGVSVKKSWALTVGAKKVRYVDPNGPEMAELRMLFAALKPTMKFNFPDDQPDNAFIQKWVDTLALTDHSFARSAGASHEFHKLLQRLDWSQTNLHLAESEWRIRSITPNNMFDRPDQIPLTLNIVRAHPDLLPAFGVQIPPSAVQFLLAPKNEITALRMDLVGSGYEGCAIRSYPTADAS